MTASVTALLTTGLAQFNAGRYAEAEASFRAALAADRESADSHHLAGLAALRLGRSADAVASIEAAIALRPREATYRLNHGVALKAAGRPVDALAAYTEAIRLAPGNPQARLNHANTLRELGRLEEAAAGYLRALELAPGAAAIHNNLGNTERELGRFESAIARYGQALALEPGYVEAMTNLGSAQIATGDFEGAHATLERALAIEPRHGVARMSLGSALAHLDRHAESEAAYREAVTLLPEFAEAHAGLGEALMRRGRIGPAIAAYETALALKPDFPAARSGLVFMRNYVAIGDPQAVTREARDYGKRLPPAIVPRHLNPPEPERPLRVGFVSGDFRSHAVAQFLLAAFAQMDQSRYALAAYMTSTHHDRTTDRFKSLMSLWRDVGMESDDALRDRIVADGIDILVDLSGHTMFNRLPLFMRRPAPVQASWLGYSGTTGVPAIDYVLGDRFVTPVGEEQQLVERPWRLPDSYLCYTPPNLDIAVGPLPALAAGHVTFGSFNNLSKLSEATVALWARVLDAVPRGRLLLKAGALDEPEIAAEVRARFTARGLGMDRLELRGRTRSAEAHLTTYNEVDIGLDPFPYNGTTTTAEALWMGVPVLGLRGDRFIAHVGESMLTSAGLSDWVAKDPEDYLHKATALASDLQRLSALRRGLRQQLVASPLCDAPRFARNLEDAFRGMWRTWCAGRAAT